MKDVVEVEVDGVDGLENVLAYCFSERLCHYGVMSFVKKRKVAIDLSASIHPITLDRLSKVVEECLGELDLSRACRLVYTDKGLKIIVTDEKHVKEVVSEHSGTLSDVLPTCPICGYVTPYPELLREHEKIHYLTL